MGHSSVFNGSYLLGCLKTVKNWHVDVLYQKLIRQTEFHTILMQGRDALALLLFTRGHG